MTLAVGVDIGGTKIATGLVSEDGKILDSASEPTPDDATKIPAIVADLVERLVGDENAAGIGIGAAGFVGEDRSTIRFAPNIDWREEPLGEHVRALVDLPVVVENDANAAAWGEFRFGAGEDTDDLLLVTIGTGIGGGIVHRGPAVPRWLRRRRRDRPHAGRARRHPVRLRPARVLGAVRQRQRPRTQCA